MMRFAFTLLAALGMAAAITFWWRPAVPPELVGSETVTAAPPEVVESEAVTAAPPEVVESEAVTAAPPEIESVVTETAAPPEVGPSLTEPTGPALPVLEEESVEIASRADFQVENVATGPPAPQGGTRARAEVPVDADRSGDLIRRMLDLYRTMRE